jgi:hypothetical protein
MTIRTFFGKLRRKFLRILLGKDLFLQLTSIREMINETQNKVAESQNVIQSKINEISGNIINTLSYNTRNYSRVLARHIHESKEIQEIHAKTFAKYRAIYKGRDVVVMGNGPTLNYYEPKKDCITIGANKIMSYDKVKIDYLFLEDRRVLEEEEMEKKILVSDCKKFFSFLGNSDWGLAEKYRHTKNMEEYCTNLLSFIDGVGWDNDDDFAGHTIPFNICNSSLSSFGSVIFPAVQFALWTYPKRIYIVGCDCSRVESNEWKLNHFFDDIKEKNNIIPIKLFVQGWHKIKEFQQRYYPDVEMISINPVFLKGLFKDEFTDSYLIDNPVADK